MNNEGPALGMVSLRGHHLICLQFFGGEGYDRDFVENLEAVLESARREGIAISSGADDICRKCPSLKDGKCGAYENAEVGIGAMDRKALEVLGLPTGEKISWAALREMIPSVFTEWHTSFCGKCDWRTACEKSPFFRQLRPGIKEGA